MLDRERIPVHLAVIMDGNGRWAEKRGLPRAAGHRAGAEALRELVHFCAELGVKYITAYAFSTENWKRPRAEVDQLMALLVEYLYRELDEMDQQDVCFRAIGNPEDLPPEARQALADAVQRTRGNSGIVVNLALNYGGRRELVEAMRRLGAEIKAGRLEPADIVENTVQSHLYTAGIPDPDLLIRPAGEHRISNFMLWQAAYTEFWMTPVLWPDFGRVHLAQALLDFQRRERRYGGLNV
ncbi:MAG: isoprenyl transferase [Candidatus Desulforudis sp.]|nr:isoprenyl transferase [Desulforudis sp.]